MVDRDREHPCHGTGKRDRSVRGGSDWALGASGEVDAMVTGIAPFGGIRRNDRSGHGSP